MNAVCGFDLTVGCDKISLEDLKKWCKENCKKWVFQKEVGEESGYEHYQGRVSLKVKSRLITLCNKTREIGIHWSITSGANSGNDWYVTKEETRVEGPWRDSETEQYIPRQVREITELREWQKTIIADKDVWDTRTINIIIDTQGNNGKSTLGTYIGAHGIGRKLPVVNDVKDIMRIVMGTEKKRLYIIDMPRALNKDKLYQFWSGIEELKNGYAWDDRYTWKEEYFDCPNIWIFTNKEPDLTLLSNDRWKIWEILENRLTPFGGAAL